jgi:hypothetical protein
MIEKKIAIVADREGAEGVQRYSRRSPRRGSSSLLRKKTKPVKKYDRVPGREQKRYEVSFQMRALTRITKLLSNGRHPSTFVPTD